MPSLGFRVNLDGYVDVSIDLLRHVAARTETALAGGRAGLLAADSPDLVRAHQAATRAAVAAGIGGEVTTDGDGTCPPVSWGERIETAHHTVDMLILESLPGVPVTANLYRPVATGSARESSGPNAAGPAVLFVCGHANLAKADPEYQAVCGRLADAGFVVLAIDPWGQGERLGYLDADGSPLVAGGTTEHTYAGIQSWWLGESPARYFVHDARRAIDLLTHLPEVDPARIGITGNSGGGMLCTLMMALEPRLAAAAVGTYLTSRASYLWTGQRQDAEQVLLGGTRNGVDHADLLAVMAPRPVAVLAAEFDFFPIEGTLDSVALAQRAYDASGAPDALRLARAHSTHRYAPELASAAVEFFGWALAGSAAPPGSAPARPGSTAPMAPPARVALATPGGATSATTSDSGAETDRAAGSDRAAEPDLLDPARLACTPSGQVALDHPDARFLYDLNLATYDALPEPTPADAVAWLRDRVAGGRRPAGRPNARWLPGPSGTAHGLWRAETDLWGAGVLLPADQTPTGGTRAVHVLLLEEGTRALTDDHPLTRRADPRDLVLALDVRGHGALTPHDRDGLPPTDQASSTYKLLCDLLWLDDSLTAARVHDVTRAVDMLLTDTHLARTYPGLATGSPVHLHGEGAGAFLAVLAAAVDERVRTVHVRDEVVEPDRLMRTRCYDDGRGGWQWVLPGMARRAPLRVLRAALGERLVGAPA
ncbi:dienelactone hydrolase family protein [Occultella aeris]|uniref:Alpha/beta hydrolase family protein n=1 Tax=Occultella aeris TaxID=2761496 RepID=A0A7M4DDK1_9MICO|nr:acetylxylan esterase [Occultella aeris]VZO34920.1 Alpha/beta hydrolase family protein [Occultella aeris]